jgi:hypothetical protein
MKNPALSKNKFEFMYNCFNEISSEYEDKDEAVLVCETIWNEQFTDSLILSEPTDIITK